MYIKKQLVILVEKEPTIEEALTWIKDEELFPNYSAQELLEILEAIAEKTDLLMADGTLVLIKEDNL